MQIVRTTVTLDPDVEALLKRVMRERGISFKEALNIAVRNALTRDRQTPAKPFRTPTFNLGIRPGINLTKAFNWPANWKMKKLCAR